MRERAKLQMTNYKTNPACKFKCRSTSFMIGHLGTGLQSFRKVKVYLNLRSELLTREMIYLKSNK